MRRIFYCRINLAILLIGRHIATMSPQAAHRRAILAAPCARPPLDGIRTGDGRSQKQPRTASWPRTQVRSVRRSPTGVWSASTSIAATRRERRREARELGYSRDEGASIERRKWDNPTCGVKPDRCGRRIRPTRRDDHIFTPCSAKYFSAPGCHGIGEFFSDWFSSAMFFASACTIASSSRFSMKVLTMS
jgi:hypothetical protein